MKFIVQRIVPVIFCGLLVSQALLMPKTDHSAEAASSIELSPSDVNLSQLDEPLRPPASEVSEPVSSEVIPVSSEQMEDLDAPIQPEFVPYETIPLSATLQKYIVELATLAEISPTLVFAIIWNESAFKVDVIGYNDNGTWDTGLMCINSSLGYPTDELLDPFRNVEIGISIIAEKIQKYGEYYGLMAYNMGNYGMLASVGAGYTYNYYANKILTTKTLFENEGRFH